MEQTKSKTEPPSNLEIAKASISSAIDDLTIALEALKDIIGQAE